MDYKATRGLLLIGVAMSNPRTRLQLRPPMACCSWSICRFTCMWHGDAARPRGMLCAGWGRRCAQAYPLARHCRAGHLSTHPTCVHFLLRKCLVAIAIGVPSMSRDRQGFVADVLSMSRGCSVNVAPPAPCPPAEAKVKIEHVRACGQPIYKYSLPYEWHSGRGPSGHRNGNIPV